MFLNSESLWVLDSIKLKIHSTKLVLLQNFSCFLLQSYRMLSRYSDQQELDHLYYISSSAISLIPNMHSCYVPQYSCLVHNKFISPNKSEISSIEERYKRLALLSVENQKYPFYPTLIVFFILSTKKE